MTRPSAEEVSRVLEYIPETGVFLWRPRNPASNFNARFAGKQAGSLVHQYRKIEWSGGRRYAAANLAWLLTYGEWPDGELDHINLIPDDNRITNLRPATRSQNAWNKTKYRNNTSGVKGIGWRARDDCWYASIRVHKKLIFLGNYKTKEAAADAYAAAAKSHHGDFARIK